MSAEEYMAVFGGLAIIVAVFVLIVRLAAAADWEDWQ